jgi:hypothetical protein
VYLTVGAVLKRPSTMKSNVPPGEVSVQSSGEVPKRIVLSVAHVAPKT